MTFESSVKFLTKFTNGSLSESISGESLSVVGTGSANIINNNSGYQMDRDQFLLLKNISANITDKFTLGFFLNPNHEGRIRSGSSTVAVKVSVLDFGMGSGSGTDFSMSRKTLIVQEECQEDGTNKMRFLLYDSSGSFAHQSLTPAYEVNKRHHFWYAYNGTSSNIDIFIDGNSVSHSENGTIPASVGLSTAALSINRYAINDSQLINSKATIDDIVLFNDFKNSEESVQKVVNNSIDYLVDNNLNNVSEIDFGLFFDDPPAVKTTSSVIDSNRVVAARTDGSLIEGSAMIWESRRDFSNIKEIESLQGNQDVATISNGLLSLSEMVSV